MDSADRRIEWLILVLGLAGVVAIWLLFAWGESPIEAWLLMSSQAAYTFTSRELGPISAMWLATDEAVGVRSDPGVPDSTLEAVPSATPLTRHRLGERLGVRVRSVLSGLHHEYLPTPACA